jgi:hypothetical protein
MIKFLKVDSKRNKCIKSDRQATCSVCEGRLHNLLCTSTLNPKIDCCPARHKMLYDNGQVQGISDSSQDMYTPDMSERPQRKFWGYSNQEGKDHE